ncbi:SH3 domain-containing protein 19 isoform X7 [Oryzias latipes]|uniref:SH3 domain-containing protein 19 isoform X7 n=1 Tax=Oryzias latipes TaxID=8090 RepID=UPI0009DAAFC7|nr:SH3 domain-containing protein 19 isoform X7 [Oryzias latipes]
MTPAESPNSQPRPRFLDALHQSGGRPERTGGPSRRTESGRKEGKGRAEKINPHVCRRKEEKEYFSGRLVLDCKQGRADRVITVDREEEEEGGRPDRRKPEQRHSQGPLSSIRAAIKRSSPRPTSLTETPADRERDRNRRPQITILSAEPLPSTSWFPGVAAGIPPPPPPAAQIWGATIPPSIQPPPSYEEVIKEKTQEQVLLPSSSPFPSINIATQTEAGPEPEQSGAERPGRPPRPPPPDKSTGDITVPSSQSAPCSQARVDTDSRGCALPETSSPPSATCAAQSDLLDLCFAAPPHDGAAGRPRPLPRSRAGLQPLRKEVKVQTLVKLRDDGAATLASRAEGSGSQQEGGQGRYLQELLQAFSSDDWGFPDHHGDGGEPSQSDSEEREEDEEDMATLKLRIQAFEQQQEAERPEPRPRPRLQGQPGRSVPPVIAPKPKTFSPAPKPSARVSLDDGCRSADQGQPETAETSSQELNPKPQTAAEASASGPSSSEPGPIRTDKKPSLAPKPRSVTETPSAASPTPVPAPRPPPPKLPTSSPLNPTPPPRPAAAPRASVGASPADRRSSVTPGGSPTSVQSGSVCAGAPTKPAAPASARRTSAPNLATRAAPVSQSPPDPNTKPTSSPPKPAGQAPPTCPAPALRKADRTHSKTPAADPPLPPRPAGAKPLPIRPPPIKSIPSRPPPPAVNLHSSSNQIPSKAAPPPSSSPGNTRAQKGGKRGPPLPPRPKPGHPLYNSYMKQEVLIVLDDPNPDPSEQVSKETKDPSSTPLILPSQELLDTPPEDTRSKPALEDLQSILPVKPVELKDQPDPAPVSGPRCVARFDYEGEEDDELTFSRGDVIALQEVMGDEWGRGQIHGKSGIFPLNFTEVLEPLPPAVTSSPGESGKVTLEETPDSALTESSQDSEGEEWVVALFDFPGQTAEDLSFQKGALIRVTERVDAEWLRGRLDGREGLFPASFAQAQPIPDQQSPVGRAAKALFNFTAEREDELTVKVGDVITQVESVDTDWILGLMDGKRGIVPKNYISFL